MTRAPKAKQATIEKRAIGRPRLETPRVRVPIQLDVTAKERWSLAAANRGLDLASWIRMICEDALRSVR